MAVTPPELLRAEWTDASRTQERMSPRQAKSRVANSDRKRLDGRHDIGYARSGVAVVPCRESLDRVRSHVRPAFNAPQKELSLKVGDGGNREGGISWRCLTPPLLHRRSDMPCPRITSSS